MNDFLSTTPFDLYELALFQLVAKHGSFTKAAEIAGRTQSAITRQVQGMENRLGLELLERTTRSVRVTTAGDFLFQESAKLLGDVEQTIQRLKQDFAGARKEVRVGVSRSISLSHLPGFFHANLRRLPEISCRVVCLPGTDILSGIAAHELDLGVLCPPTRLPQTVRITHRFADAFTLIAPVAVAENFQSLPKSGRTRAAWLAKQNWLLIEEGTVTGQQLRRWMAREGLAAEPAMQLDSFDLIINLVSLGMGISFVPMRALALYGAKHTLTRVSLPRRFERELVVVLRRHRELPEHLTRFVENVLF